MTFSMQIILLGEGGPFSTVEDDSKKQHSFGFSFHCCMFFSLLVGKGGPYNLFDGE